MTSNGNYRIRVSEPAISESELRSAYATMAQGELTMSGGRAVARFEEAIAHYCDVPNAVSCSSGTAALHLALLALGIGPGQRVAVPALTYVATVAAICYVGAEPVFVDVDYQTWTMDPVKFAAVAPFCHAVIPVHLFGQPAEMSSISITARHHDCLIIEDSAQAFGARYQGHTLWGDVATFSFYANKVITTAGEGGAVITRDSNIAGRLRLFRGQGQDATRRYWHTVVGHNYRMTAVQAAFGLAQLARVDELIDARRVVGDVYRAKLASWPQPLPVYGATPVDWLFSVLLPTHVDRDAVITAMGRDCGIETRPVFASAATMPPYRQWADADTALLNTDMIARRGLSLPTHPLMVERDARSVVDALRTVVASLSGDGNAQSSGNGGGL